MRKNESSCFYSIWLFIELMVPIVANRTRVWANQRCNFPLAMPVKQTKTVECRHIEAAKTRCELTASKKKNETTTPSTFVGDGVQALPVSNYINVYIYNKSYEMHLNVYLNGQILRLGTFHYIYQVCTTCWRFYVTIKVHEPRECAQTAQNAEVQSHRFHEKPWGRTDVSTFEHSFSFSPSISLTHSFCLNVKNHDSRSVCITACTQLNVKNWISLQSNREKRETGKKNCIWTSGWNENWRKRI